MVMKPLNLQCSSCGKVLIVHIHRISAMCDGQAIYSAIRIMKTDIENFMLNERSTF